VIERMLDGDVLTTMLERTSYGSIDGMIEEVSVQPRYRIDNSTSFSWVDRKDEKRDGWEGIPRGELNPERRLTMR
jgi:hypothetical protein